MSLRERIHPRLGPKCFARLPAATFGILGVAVVAGQPTSATAQSYPWCAQGDSIVHCYYTTREQCEEGPRWDLIASSSTVHPAQGAAGELRSCYAKKQQATDPSGPFVALARSPS